MPATDTELLRTGEGSFCFLRCEPSGPSERKAVAGLQLEAALARRGSVLRFVGFGERGKERLRLLDLRKFRRRRKAFERGRKHGVGVGGAVGAIDKASPATSAARSSKLRAFCCRATATAARNASSAGAVFAGSRLSRISPRMRCRKAVVLVFSRLVRERQCLRRSGSRLPRRLPVWLRSRRATAWNDGTANLKPCSVNAASACRSSVRPASSSPSRARAQPEQTAAWAR